MFEFLASAFVLGVVVAIPPGSVTLVACQRALEHGFGNSLWFSLGSATADLFYLVLVWCGLAGALAALPGFDTLLWLCCGSLLVALGAWSLIGLRPPAEGVPAPGPRVLATHRGATYLSGVLVTLSNPLTIVGWLGVAGNFFLAWRERFPLGGAMGLLALPIIMAGVLAWFLPLTAAVSRLGRLLGLGARRWLFILANAALLLFGLAALGSGLRGLFA